MSILEKMGSYIGSAVPLMTSRNKIEKASEIR
jgi:hypothetical protein